MVFHFILVRVKIKPKYAHRCVCMPVFVQDTYLLYQKLSNLIFNYRHTDLSLSGPIPKCLIWISFTAKNNSIQFIWFTEIELHHTDVFQFDDCYKISRGFTDWIYIIFGLWACVRKWFICNTYLFVCFFLPLSLYRFTFFSSLILQILFNNSRAMQSVAVRKKIL